MFTIPIIIAVLSGGLSIALKLSDEKNKKDENEKNRRNENEKNRRNENENQTLKTICEEIQKVKSTNQEILVNLKTSNTQLVFRYLLDKVCVSFLVAIAANVISSKLF